MITGSVSITIYGNDEGTHTYAVMEVNRPLSGPYAIHLDGHSYTPFQPTLEGLEGCVLGADGVECSFRMGPIFPRATLRKEGFQPLTFVLPWNTKIQFSLLTLEEQEQESWERACHNEKMSEFHAERAFAQN